MDQSSPDFFLERRRNRSGNISFPFLDILSDSGDTRDQSRRLYEIDRNFACFGPHFFVGWGKLPEFLESIYKIDTGSDHVSKFRGDRPRELGDYAMKKRKTSRAFYKTSRTTVQGGLRTASNLFNVV